jgi:hypothetical protein
VSRTRLGEQHTNTQLPSMHIQQKVAFILHYETAAKRICSQLALLTSTPLLVLSASKLLNHACSVAQSSKRHQLLHQPFSHGSGCLFFSAFSAFSAFLPNLSPNQDLERREREREGRARRSHLENRTYARQISRSEVRLDVLLLASLHKQARFRNAPLSDMDEGGHGVNSFIRDL